ncbi:MAG: nitroreductase family protein [Tannerellaceae bacterium]|nr:nitroreductase family protein [Tannerellaceae bacterium]
MNFLLIDVYRKMDSIKSDLLNTPGLQTIFSRKSIRAFTDEPVEKEMVDILLRAGMAAPSAVNQQPWAFIVIDDRTILNQLSEELPFAKMVAKAPLAIVVCGDPDKSIYGKEFWIQDCSAASENILLAAEALGLGAVWTSTYPDTERIQTVRKILHLPENIFPLNLIPVGHPKNEHAPKNKFRTNNIHRNRWHTPE